MSDTDNNAAPSIDADEAVKQQQTATPPRTEEEEKQERDYWESFWQDAANKDLLEQRKRIEEFLSALQTVLGKKLEHPAQTGDKEKDQQAFSTYYKSALNGASLLKVEKTEDKKAVFSIQGKPDHHITATPKRVEFHTDSKSDLAVKFDDEAAFAMALVAMKMGHKHIQFQGNNDQKKRLRAAVTAVNAFYSSEQKMVIHGFEPTRWQRFIRTKSETAPDAEEMKVRFASFYAKAENTSAPQSADTAQPPTNTNPNPPSPTPESLKTSSSAAYKHDDVMEISNADAPKAAEPVAGAVIDLSDNADTLENAIEKDAKSADTSIQSSDFADIEKQDIPPVQTNSDFGPIAISDQEFTAAELDALKAGSAASKPALSTKSTAEELRKEQVQQPSLKQEVAALSEKTTNALSREQIEDKLALTSTQAKGLLEKLSQNIPQAIATDVIENSLKERFNDLAQPVQGIVRKAFTFPKNTTAEQREKDIKNKWNGASEKDRLLLVKDGLAKSFQDNTSGAKRKPSAKAGQRKKQEPQGPVQTIA